MEASGMKELAELYSGAIREAYRRLFLENWIFIPLSLAMLLAWGLVVQLVAPLGLIGGFLASIIELCALTYYYTWLANILSLQRLRLKSMGEFDGEMFMRILSVAFILWIVKFLTAAISQSQPSLNSIPMIVQLGIVVIFNPIPEVLYIDRDESLQALSRALEVIKRFWIEWYLPLAVLMAPLFLLLGAASVVALAGADEFLPLMLIVRAWGALSGAIPPLIMWVFGFVLGSFYMVFRGCLYERLSRRR